MSWGTIPKNRGKSKGCGELLPGKEAKIAQVSSRGRTDLLLKWIIITVFLPQNKSDARGSKPKRSLNDIAFLSERVCMTDILTKTM